MSAVQTLESAVACHAMKSLVLGDMLEQSLILVFFHDEAMLGLGKLSLANVFLEVSKRLADHIPAVCVLLDEFWREPVE